jgi:hypothetical protein
VRFTATASAAEPRGAAGGRSSNTNIISVRRQPELNEKEIGDGGQQAAPAGRSASCAHARNLSDRGQRGPKLLIFQSRTLAMTPWLAGAAAAAASHHRPPRSPELQRPPRSGFRISASSHSCRPCGPSGSRCRPRSCRRGPRAREAMDKEEERASPKPLVFQCRLLAMTP